MLKTTRRAATLALLSCSIVTPALAEPEQAGVTAAVNPDAQGTPPGGHTEYLALGTNIARNEHVATGPSGQAQLLFNDGSTLTVGPSADLVIDEYVYDPSSGTGHMAVTAVSGVLRFVGGRISKTTPVTFETATGTIGIRGGIGLIEPNFDGKGGLRGTMLYGKDMSVRSKSGATETITRAGFSTEFSKTDGAPHTPHRVDPLVLAAVNDQLQGKEGQNGGTASPITVAQIDRGSDAVARVNSDQPAPTGGTNPVPSPTDDTKGAQTAQILTQSGLDKRASDNGSGSSGGKNFNSDGSPITGANGSTSSGTTTLAAFQPNQSALSAQTSSVFGSGNYTNPALADVIATDGNGASTTHSAFTSVTAAVTERYLDTDVEIGRYTTGSITTSGTAFTLAASGSSLVYMTAIPTTSLPTSGTATYNVSQQTAPILFNSGTWTATPGTFAANLTAAFASGGSNVTLNNGSLTGIGDGVTYSLASASAPVTAANQSFILNPIVTAAGGTPFFGSITGPTTVQGTFAGPSGNRIGLTYLIEGYYGSITGAAILK